MKKLMIFVVVTCFYSQVLGAAGDIWNLAEDFNPVQNGATVIKPGGGSGIWTYGYTDGVNDTPFTESVIDNYPAELPIPSAGWYLSSQPWVSMQLFGPGADGRAQGLKTVYLEGDVGGHASIYASWTSVDGGLFRVDAGGYNGRRQETDPNNPNSPAELGRPATLILEDSYQSQSVPIEAAINNSSNDAVELATIIKLSPGEKFTIRVVGGDWVGMKIRIEELPLGSVVWDLSDDFNPTQNGATVIKNSEQAIWTYGFTDGTIDTPFSTSVVDNYPSELPVPSAGWHIPSQPWVSMQLFGPGADGRAQGLKTCYTEGDVGGHASIYASWTSLDGGAFLVSSSGYNARRQESDPNNPNTPGELGRPNTLYLVDPLQTQSVPIDPALNNCSDNAIDLFSAIELLPGESIITRIVGSDWAGMKMRIEKADADLTITASPANVTSVTPYVNETQNQFIGIPISIEALRFVDCPTDSVMVFDHWVPGANTFVTDPYAASTTVVVTAAGSADITAVYVDDRKCGDECHPIIPEDLNGDCLVNLIDLSRLVSVWLNDNTVK